MASSPKFQIPRSSWISTTVHLKNYWSLHDEPRQVFCRIFGESTGEARWLCIPNAPWYRLNIQPGRSQELMSNCHCECFFAYNRCGLVHGTVTGISTSGNWGACRIRQLHPVGAFDLFRRFNNSFGEKRYEKAKTSSKLALNLRMRPSFTFSLNEKKQTLPPWLWLVKKSAERSFRAT